MLFFNDHAPSPQADDTLDTHASYAANGVHSLGLGLHVSMNLDGAVVLAADVKHFERATVFAGDRLAGGLEDIVHREQGLRRGLYPNGQAPLDLFKQLRGCFPALEL